MGKAMGNEYGNVIFEEQKMTSTLDNGWWFRTMEFSWLIYG